MTATGRPALKLVHDARADERSWRWFCGHCAEAAPDTEPPLPAARVCRSCGLGLMLETREDAMPVAGDAFVVLDSRLLVHAMSRDAEVLLGVSEEMAVNRPVSELLVAADAESPQPSAFAAAVVAAMAGEEPVHAFVRPWNTFGVRLRARVATCGPPRAALVVLETARGRLHAVEAPGPRAALLTV